MAGAGLWRVGREFIAQRMQSRDMSGNALQSAARKDARRVLDSHRSRHLSCHHSKSNKRQNKEGMHQAKYQLTQSKNVPKRSLLGSQA